MNLKNNTSNPQKKFLLQSYSQSGEDRIIDFLIKSIKIENPSYIDIGAYHPYKISNTALFYEEGFRGINIEPDPTLFKEFEKYRPEDINLNVGIGERKGEFQFYRMSIPTLNTFSRIEAEKNEKFDDIKIIDVINIKTFTLQEIIKKYHSDTFPDLMSLDVEGLDLEILNSIDYNVTKPKIICVETIPFTNGGIAKKNSRITELLKKKGYMAYADTFINTIFVEKKLWENR
jgi:FkbM family methyltransferase